MGKTGTDCVAPEMELEVQCQEHDLGEYPLIVLI
jgi:hypothetical protein